MKATKLYEHPSAELVEVEMERNIMSEVESLTQITGSFDEDE